MSPPSAFQKGISPLRKRGARGDFTQYVFSTINSSVNNVFTGC
jgi:hypothetical protein